MTQTVISSSSTIRPRLHPDVTSLLLYYTHLPDSFKRFRCEVNRKKSKFERYHLCLLKNLGSLQALCPFWPPGWSLFSFSRPGSCSCDLRGWLTAEESHQPFQVLHRCRQVELLAHEAHPA